LGGAVNLASVGMGGGVAEETVETGHGVGGGKACSEARAQVAGKKRGSTDRP
jgi:hypothetical protein